jgi:hypothetical protein
MIVGIGNGRRMFVGGSVGIIGIVGSIGIFVFIL